MASSCSLMVRSGPFALQSVVVVPTGLSMSPPSSRVKVRPCETFKEHGRFDSRTALLGNCNPLIPPLPKHWRLTFLGGRSRLSAPRLKIVRGDSLEVTGAPTRGRANPSLEEGRLDSERGSPRGLEVSHESSGPGKSCLECHRRKPLIDFKKTVTSPDGRVDVCRACLATLWAKESNKELHHLGMSVEEAWEKGKVCSSCGCFKECRDFVWRQKSKDKMNYQCRSCHSAYQENKLAVVPLDTNRRCGVCKEVKAATAFYFKKQTGLESICKECNKKLERKHSGLTIQRRKEKVCSACGKVKETSEFNRMSNSLDGLRHTCRECLRAKYLAKAKQKRAAEGKGSDDGLV